MILRRAVTLCGCLSLPWLFAMACDGTAPATPEGIDAAVDAQLDVLPAPPDASDEAAVPPIGALHYVPAPTDCPDAGANPIYVVTEQSELYTFYPPTLAFSKIGTAACPTTKAPFSMAVDRVGNAYSVFTDGSLFRIRTADGACSATTFAAGQNGFDVFGMGYAAAADGGDTLYVAQSGAGPSKGLASIDTTSLALSFIAAFNLPLNRCELTGTGDGRLFAFCPTSGNASMLAEIDPSSANVIAADTFKLDLGNAWAFAVWGGDFWIFTAPGGKQTVTKYEPLAKTLTAVATFSSIIVGAGVSSCAPQ